MLVMFQPLEATEQFQLIRISWYFLLRKMTSLQALHLFLSRTLKLAIVCSIETKRFVVRMGAYSTPTFSTA